jgi:hypothetical protein
MQFDFAELQATILCWATNAIPLFGGAHFTAFVCVK